MKPRKPLRRTYLKRSTKPIARSPLKRNQKPLKRSPLKRSTRPLNTTRSEKSFAKRSTFLSRKRKPAPNSDAVRVYRGGREVCQNNAAGDALYKHRTQLMMVRQGWICCICKDPSRPIRVASGVTFEHTDL